MHALGRRALAARHASRLSRPARPPLSATAASTAPQLFQRRTFCPSLHTAKQESSPPSSETVDNGGAKPEGVPSEPVEEASKEEGEEPVKPSPVAATTIEEEPEQGRRPPRRSPPLRNRALKTKRYSALPRVSFPPRFFRDHVLLHHKKESAKAFSAFNNRNTLGWSMLQGLIADLLNVDMCNSLSVYNESFLGSIDTALNMIQWNERLVGSALDGDLDAVSRRTDMIINLLWRATTSRSFNIDACNATIGDVDPSKSTAPLKGNDWFTRHEVAGWDGGSVLRHCLAFYNIIQYVHDPVICDNILKMLLTDAIAHDVPPALLLSWLNIEVYQTLRNALEGEFLVEPTTKAQLSGDSKRPITVLTIPNYNGKMFSRAIVSAVATSLDADLITLDARTLSIVVGEYLGQDWSYARGPVSMLGFRVADINGRLGRNPELDKSLARPPADNEDGPDALVNVQANYADGEKTPMEKELQKIKDCARDYILPSTDKWENLKINAVLEQLVQAANIKAAMTGASKPLNEKRLLLHVDDFIELNMTIEGSLMLGRLRNIVDALWQNGYQVTMIGTSSFENPTEQFSSTLNDIAAEECHISCPLHLSRASYWGLTAEQYGKMTNSRRPQNTEDKLELYTEFRKHFELDTTDALPKAVGSDAADPFQSYVDRLKQSEYQEETVRNIVNVLRGMSQDAAASLQLVYDTFQPQIIHDDYLVYDGKVGTLPLSALEREHEGLKREKDEVEEGKRGDESAASPEARSEETPSTKDATKVKDGAVEGVVAEDAQSESVKGTFANDAVANDNVVEDVDQDIEQATGDVVAADAMAKDTETKDVAAENAAAENEPLSENTPSSESPKSQEDNTAEEDLEETHQNWEGVVKSVLPHTAVYDIARQYCQSRQSGSVRRSELADQSPLDVLYYLLYRREKWPSGADHRVALEKAAEQAQKANTSGASDANAELKLDEHEKKLLPGLIKADTIKTTFDDIHLPKETIATVRLLTSLSLVRPDALSYGILAKERMPGCLLYGPPGTGKTLLAKAMAKESGANVLEVTGASIEDMWVGESEKNVRALFSLAKKLSPMVVFIDEADSLLGSRSLRRSRPTRRETLNQFLREWDGMTETSALIMVATNRPDDLDDAILRRLPRKILVDLPLEADRAVILKIFLKDEKTDGSVSVEGLAKRTPFYSGSDLKNLCVAAAMAAVREENEAAEKHTGPEKYVFPERRILRQDHFEQALKEVTASVNADTPSLKALRKFDEMYGKPAGAKKAKSMGFGIGGAPRDAEEARIRKPEAA